MSRQLKLNIYQGQRGGRRPGAGRKRLHSPGVAHQTREIVQKRFALHINFKVCLTIRNKQGLQVLKRAIRNARSKGLAIVHFSLQSNHVHLIVEATDNQILTRGMRSLTITFAKGIAAGRIQRERYHLHVLRTLRETRNAVHYVLFNQQKHTGLKTAYIDPYSSLGAIKELQALAKKANMTIIMRGLSEMNFLDPGSGWMLRKATL